MVSLVVIFRKKIVAHIAIINPTKTAISNPLRSETLFFMLLYFLPGVGCCIFISKLYFIVAKTIWFKLIFWCNFHSLYLSFNFLILVTTKAIVDISKTIERYIGPYTKYTYSNLMPDKSWKWTVSKKSPTKNLELWILS